MSNDTTLLEPQVERKLATMWPSEQERATARAELARYGIQSHELEAERVRLAILKLSDGALDELRRMTAAAKMDYRDVLLWAEYPEEAKVLFQFGPNMTEQQREELVRIRARDRAQLEAWLRK